MEIQDLEWAEAKITKHFQKNPRASISAAYRNLRKAPRLSFFGDYVLMCVVVGVLYELDIPIKKRSLQWAMYQSEELKGNRAVLHQLLNSELFVSYKSQMPLNGRLNTISSSCIIQL